MHHFSPIRWVAHEAGCYLHDILQLQVGMLNTREEHRAILEVSSAWIPTVGFGQPV